MVNKEYEEAFEELKENLSSLGFFSSNFELINSLAVGFKDAQDGSSFDELMAFLANNNRKEIADNILALTQQA